VGIRHRLDFGNQRSQCLDGEVWGAVVNNNYQQAHRRWNEVNHGEEKPKAGILQSACPLCKLFYRATVLPRHSPIAPPASPTGTDPGHTCFAEAFG